MSIKFTVLQEFQRKPTGSHSPDSTTNCHIPDTEAAADLSPWSPLAGSEVPCDRNSSWQSRIEGLAVWHLEEFDTIWCITDPGLRWICASKGLHPNINLVGRQVNEENSGRLSQNPWFGGVIGRNFDLS
jgi:hypothetical protein